MSLNAVFLKGNLTRDPLVKVIKTATKETKVATFTVAVSRQYRKANGERDKETNFIFCEAWDTGAEQIEKLLHKGDPVVVEGSLKEETWEKDGEKKSRLKVRVSSFDRLHRSNFTKTESNETTEPVGAGAGPNGEGLPF